MGELCSLSVYYYLFLMFVLPSVIGQDCGLYFCSYCDFYLVCVAFHYLSTYLAHFCFPLIVPFNIAYTISVLLFNAYC
jgi:hypothetical protein